MDAFCGRIFALYWGREALCERLGAFCEDIGTFSGGTGAFCGCGGGACGCTNNADENTLQIILFFC